MDKIQAMEKEPTRHALLGASNSHRWLECTPSARAEEAYPDKGSEYAAEGTLAHALAARSLKKGLGLAHDEEDREINELKDFRTGEMGECVADYHEFVMSRYWDAVRETPEGKVKPEIRIEQRLDYSDWVPDGFGTGDAVIMSYDTVEIIDLKYGKGVKVDATDNPQMKLYALGALAYYDYAFGDIEKVRMTIYQPRVGNISTWETTISELLDWADETVRPTARMAFRGLGARKSGEWCRFCKAKGDCGRLATDSWVNYRKYGTDGDINLKERSTLLAALPAMKDWISSLEARSLEMALQGTEIPGFKVVEGRSVRKIVDKVAVVTKLVMNGYDSEVIMKPKELKNLTDLEQIVGKKEFARLCGEWIEKPAGKPTLVAVADKRESINNNDFKDLEI